MIDDVVANEALRKFFKNELKAGRPNGTYLFYGRDDALILRYALAFSKGLCCETLTGDFCDECNSCRKINHGVYSDLEILESAGGALKVDDVRDLILKSSVTAFEGKNKIFILKNMENIAPVAANALLKLIEEPNPHCFFILLSKSLNILPTIKSRSILVKIREMTAEELGVPEAVHYFFQGASDDILAYKDSGLSLGDDEPFLAIGKHLRKYAEENDFSGKLGVYKAIRNYLDQRAYLPLKDKLAFVEEIMKYGGNREIYKEIIRYGVHAMSYGEGLEKRLSVKATLRYPVNVKLALLQIFL
ncbi:MAG: ATPase [Fusobacteriaceae bacterium]|jgi:DNA polymerase-3 subunit delta'|nr:ATPase [Fusobacteriaceae bacterium]